MVNQKIFEKMLSQLDDALKKLEILADYSQDAFLEDFTKVESAKHLLQVAIMCCIDIAQHIIADEGYRPVETYYEMFVVLNEEGIIPAEFMPTLREMVGFRNRVVHLYWEVDDLIVYNLLQNNLNDFHQFIKYVLDVFM